MAGRIAPFLLFLFLVTKVTPWRPEPTEPFAPPFLVKDDPNLIKAFDKLEATIRHAVKSGSSPWRTNITSFTISVTSASETLWTTSSTAPVLGNYVDSPSSNVTEHTYFRIASISKVFTVLAVLIEQQVKNCSLQDPITRYLPELLEGANAGGIDWNAITLGTLASQLSGIPREYGQSDLIDPIEDLQYGFEDPIDVGLPRVDDEDIPPCGENRPGTRPCTRKELLDGLLKRPSMYQPNYRATYSNMAFVLLGFALEALTGLSYAEIVYTNVFHPVGMENSKLSKPLDTEGVIPNMTNDWNADIGTYGPTGGFYTTVSDLACFARAVFTNKLLDKAATNAWFKPLSYSESWSFAYGMPWEIFRTEDLLPDSSRIQTVVTKAGGLRGYSSHLVLIPEYEISIAVLVAGDGHALSWLREEVLTAVVPVVEDITREQTAKRLGGIYSSSTPSVNSSITLEVQGPSGLVVASWISNGTDFLARYIDMSQRAGGVGRPGKVRLTSADTERAGKGEVWRSQFIPDEVPLKGVINTQIITDVDTFTYAARSMEEFVFKIGDAGYATEIELPAFRTKLIKHKQPIAGNTFGGRRYPLMKPIGLEP